MNIELKDVHIGEAIERRLKEIKMTKTDFGRLIDVPQQHVNRIFSRDTIETKKLERICRALDYNFFALYCNFPSQISAFLSAIALGDGDANNIIGDASILANMEMWKIKKEAKEETEKLLRDQIQDLKNSIDQLKANLNDKETIINLLQQQLELHSKNK